MNISYALTAGKKHIELGRPCEDFIAYHSDDTIFAAALADGAGSKPMARQCARLLTQLTVDYIASQPGSIGHFDSENFISHVNKYLLAHGLTPENAGSTLLFWATDHERFVCGHIGDGVVITGTESGFRVCSAPENGEFANQTFLLPFADCLSHFRTVSGELEGNVCVIMASDGIADSLYDRRSGDPAPVCAKLASYATLMDPDAFSRELRRSLDETFSRFSSDDMSLIVISGGRED